MRILKGKIAKALEALKRKQIITQEKELELIPEIEILPKQEVIQRTRSQRTERRAQPSETASPNSPATLKGSTSAKNIMKNYSRALVNFALSDLALPYLTKMLDSMDVRLEEFKGFLQSQKSRINCIKSLRELLLYEDRDPKTIKHMKSIFKQISIVFIKYFSVNWIFQSKIHDRKTHLKYRFKILRRINDPAHFTYLEDFTK